LLVAFDVPQPEQDSSLSSKRQPFFHGFPVPASRRAWPTARKCPVIPSEARNLALLVAFDVPQPEQDSSLSSERQPLFHGFWVPASRRAWPTALKMPCHSERSEESCSACRLRCARARTRFLA
jgi:hypothetical protein